VLAIGLSTILWGTLLCLIWSVQSAVFLREFADICPSVIRSPFTVVIQGLLGLTLCLVAWPPLLYLSSSIHQLFAPLKKTKKSLLVCSHPLHNIFINCININIIHKYHPTMPKSKRSQRGASVGFFLFLLLPVFHKTRARNCARASTVKTRMFSGLH